ncbi:MAG: GntR family transcriptional regulator [Lachnospiraceae bacterium]|nr:GntR family transcriptional regulator [Lachnospiraceae bacterium]
MYIEEREPGETGRDYALRTLKENIINLDLEPGSMVSEKDLASELGLSRTPVREALMDLARAKMVEIYPQRGSRISLIDYTFAEDTQFTRSIIEAVTVQLACQKATKEDVRILRENVMLQEFNIDNSRKMMQLDDEFHRELFRIAGKMNTWNMLRDYSIHFDRIRQMALHAVRELKIVDDHKKICSAVEQRDEELAQSCMKEHLSRYKVDEESIRKRYPAEYFAS